MLDSVGTASFNQKTYSFLISSFITPDKYKMKAIKQQLENLDLIEQITIPNPNSATGMDIVFKVNQDLLKKVKAVGKE